MHGFCLAVWCVRSGFLPIFLADPRAALYLLQPLGKGRLSRACPVDGTKLLESLHFFL